MKDLAANKESISLSRIDSETIEMRRAESGKVIIKSTPRRRVVRAQLVQIDNSYLYDDTRQEIQHRIYSRFYLQINIYIYSIKFNIKEFVTI